MCRTRRLKERLEIKGTFTRVFVTGKERKDNVCSSSANEEIVQIGEKLILPDFETNLANGEDNVLKPPASGRNCISELITA